ncbi:hypothetical protein T492DRAFT_865438 [Pavlovales sp. CCMP2436]|nr:hypothetical protein T492DRAFT_865438 [Pavlovales sp. CCMP2436]
MLGRTPARRALARWLSAGPPAHGYVQRTVVPTFHFQDSLPRLPIPPLEATVARYLYFAQPLVPASQLEGTRELLRAFTAGQGAVLQAELARRDKLSYSSFISAPWFDMYLKDRRPLPLHSNPHLAWVDETEPGRAEQVGRAARLVDASVAFYRTLRDGELGPDVFHTKPKLTETAWWEAFASRLPRSVAFYGAAALGAYPLDMSQYANLFETTRVPRRGRDELRKASGGSSLARHVVVQRGARFWQLQAVAADGTSVGAAALELALRAVLDAAPAGTQQQPPLGLLTSLPRDEWADARAAIEASSVQDC